MDFAHDFHMGYIMLNMVAWYSILLTTRGGNRA